MARWGYLVTVNVSHGVQQLLCSRRKRHGVSYGTPIRFPLPYPLQVAKELNDGAPEQPPGTSSRGGRDARDA